MGKYLDAARRAIVPNPTSGVADKDERENAIKEACQTIGESWWWFPGSESDEAWDRIKKQPDRWQAISVAEDRMNESFERDEPLAVLERCCHAWRCAWEMAIKDAKGSN